jgi:hypothetical protein
MRREQNRRHIHERQGWPFLDILLTNTVPISVCCREFATLLKCRLSKFGTVPVAGESSIQVSIMGIPGQIYAEVIHLSFTGFATWLALKPNAHWTV